MEFNKDDFKVLRIPFSEAKEWVLYKHYAHRIPPVSFAFGLYGGGGNFKVFAPLDLRHLTT